jgi:hypothetical protein
MPDEEASDEIVQGDGCDMSFQKRPVFLHIPLAA